nr:MAG TPA: hypothetical protein [Microviridae sp.]
MNNFAPILNLTLFFFCCCFAIKIKPVYLCC